VRCRKNGVEAEIECDFIAGCDGFHGVSRQTISEAAIRTYERVYPFGRLGILCETLPVSRELIYVNHDRGFALCSMRSQGRSRLYIQCRLDDSIEGLARRAVLGGAEASSRSQGGHNHRDPAVDREEHRTAAQLCRRADAVRAAVPSGRRRPHRAADRRQGLNLAASDVYYLWQAFADFYDAKSTAGLDAYSDRALARVWQAERFSWWMTMLLHRFPERSGFDQKVQRAELEYLARSQTVQASLAENYVGLPY
jgi:p-hydroxybenzoate 3-monooxygenase